MSENRPNYSSVPSQDLKRRPPRQAQAKPAKNQPAAPAGQGSHIALQIMLVAILPIAFVVALIAKNNPLYWGFVILSLGSLLIMYLLKAFVPNARRVLSVIHAAMVVVILFSLAVSRPALDETRTPTAQDLQSIFSDDTTASITDMSETQQNISEEDTPDIGTASQAQQKLEQFMAAWAVKDYASMVTYSAPNWANQFETQRDAETSIFHLSAIRTPVSYQIMDVSGSDTDQTRTITMQASINKNDGKAPELYNFQILMIRNNNEWYVDPNSISSSQIVQQAAIQPQTPQQATTQVQDAAAAAVQSVQVPQINAAQSDTLLYYNQDGGRYYHIDPNCSSIGAEYKPLKASFYYRDVSNDTFKNLITCPYCNAPARP